MGPLSLCSDVSFLVKSRMVRSGRQGLGFGPLQNLGCGGLD